MLEPGFDVSQRVEAYAGNGARVQLSPTIEAFTMLEKELQGVDEALDTLSKRLEIVLTPAGPIENQALPSLDPNCRLAQVGVELFVHAAHLRANLKALIARLAI